MALVLALGSLGAAFAAWTDTVTLNGSVTTGTVDINVVGYSSTWVYKVPGAENEIEVIHHNLPTEPDPRPVGAIMVPRPPDSCQDFPYAIAYAIASPGAEDDEVDVVYFNLFPSIDFIADILLHYEGSIPVKVNVANITGVTGDQGGDWMTPLYNQPAYPANPLPEGIWIWGFESTSAGNRGDFYEYAVGQQLHYCDYILIEFHMHLPQDGTLMTRSGSFTAELEVVQWNEYPHAP